jgi:hypothetical protein
MLDTTQRGINWHTWAQFENFEVVRLYVRLKRGIINVAGSGRAMIASGKLHVMDVKACKAAGE